MGVGLTSRVCPPMRNMAGLPSLHKLLARSGLVVNDKSYDIETRGVVDDNSERSTWPIRVSCRNMRLPLKGNFKILLLAIDRNLQSPHQALSPPLEINQPECKIRNTISPVPIIPVLARKACHPFLVVASPHVAPINPTN
jgi:hypothetical protein